MDPSDAWKFLDLSLYLCWIFATSEAVRPAISLWVSAADQDSLLLHPSFPHPPPPLSPLPLLECPNSNMRAPLGPSDEEEKVCRRYHIHSSRIGKLCSLWENTNFIFTSGCRTDTSLKHLFYRFHSFYPSIPWLPSRLVYPNGLFFSLGLRLKYTIVIRRQTVGKWFMSPPKRGEARKYFESPSFIPSSVRERGNLGWLQMPQ